MWEDFLASVSPKVERIKSNFAKHEEALHCAFDALDRLKDGLSNVAQRILSGVASDSSFRFASPAATIFTASSTSPPTAAGANNAQTFYGTGAFGAWFRHLADRGH